MKAKVHAGMSWAGLLVVALILPGCSSKTSGSAEMRDENLPQVRRQPYREHIVRKGDTLFSIARELGCPWQDLARQNALSEPYTIHPEQRLHCGSKPARVVSAPPRRPFVGNSESTKRISGAGKATVNNSAGPSDSVSKPLSTESTLPSGPAPTGWQWPVSGAVIAPFSSNGSLNKGIDLGGQLGEPVHAALNGSVVYAGSALKGYGELIILKHSGAFVSAYGHNRRLLVTEGQQVKAGQVIAEMGSSGTDRVKLHFEIRRRGKPVDPLQYLPPR